MKHANSQEQIEDCVTAISACWKGRKEGRKQKEEGGWKLTSVKIQGLIKAPLAIMVVASPGMFLM